MSKEEDYQQDEVKIIKLYVPSAEEEAQIQAWIDEDPDAMDDDGWTFLGNIQQRPVKVVLVEGEENPYPWPDPKTQDLLQIYVDQDVVDYFKGLDPFWTAPTAPMNTALRLAAFGEEGKEVRPHPVIPRLLENEDDLEAGQMAATRELVYIYVDRDVVAQFKASGDLWQERMNAALRRAAFGDASPEGDEC